MRPINEIVVHCTATHPGWWSSKTVNQKIAEIRRWHIEERGWSDIGYHFLIDRDGKVGLGRPVERVGAHVFGRNENTIGVSLFGGYDSAETDSFDKNYTDKQADSFKELLIKITSQHKIKIISGHNQYAAKACPGFSVPKWISP